MNPVISILLLGIILIGLYTVVHENTMASVMYVYGCRNISFFWEHGLDPMHISADCSNLDSQGLLMLKHDEASAVVSQYPYLIFIALFLVFIGYVYYGGWPGRL